MSNAIFTPIATAPRGHYSQAVQAGDFLFISGQLPLDSSGYLVTGTISDEAKQALSNLRAIVEAAGATLADVVQCTIYISDLSFWSDVNDVYGSFFSAAPVPPARAIVPVQQMHYGSHIEIQAVAMLKSGTANTTGTVHS
jgi:2-iminobutanoate/2-iminopropanoate deaminase